MNIGVNEFYINKEMKRGIAKVVILSYIKNNQTYPYEMLKTIRNMKLMHGRKVFSDFTKSDIYNLLVTLEKDGYINGKAKLKGNKVQKIYTITKKGSDVVENKDKIFLGMITALRKLVKEEFNVQ